jgi:hypothetical protein
MKLPHPLLESPFFLFESAADLVTALGGEVSIGDVVEIERLSAIGLPPIISRDSLAVMLGLNPGLLWSFEKRPHKYYRHFIIKKGTGVRHIYAPKVAIKMIQKWCSIHFNRCYEAPSHVFGFVPGRSHLQAANVHLGASWVFSCDVRDFFPSTTSDIVAQSLVSLGYEEESASYIGKFLCYNGGLAQGSPASPVISNVAFRNVDNSLEKLAEQYSARLSRYADDIVFSGADKFPEGLPVAIGQLFGELPWKLAPEKTEVSISPQRLKVHGLLVHGDRIRLTKGYRNRIRAYNHLLEAQKIREDDFRRVRGHVLFAKQVSDYGTS